MRWKARKNLAGLDFRFIKLQVIIMTKSGSNTASMVYRNVTVIRFFFILYSELHTVDLIIHDFELHEFFHSPKNVYLKALLYTQGSF